MSCSSRRALAFATALACAALVSAGAAGAGRENLALPSTGTPLSEKPPLLAGLQQFNPVFHGHIASREQVRALLDPAGSVVAVRSVQRLVVGRGDYFFAVPAPVVDVSAAPGSESQPGLRPGAVLWQGFSAGSRVLAAAVRLRLNQSSPSLPLAVAARVQVDGAPLVPGKPRSGTLDLTVRIENRTSVRTDTFGGVSATDDLARLLDTLRRVDAGDRSFTPFLRVQTPVKKARLRVSAPLRVSGTIEVPARSGGRRLLVSRLLGDGEPLTLTIHARGRVVDAQPPKIDLVVTPVAPRNTLRPPAGGSWLAAARAGHTPAPRQMLETAIRALLQLARAGQYERYLANPDPGGASTTAYHYVSGSVPRATPAPPPSGGGGPPWAAIAGVTIAAALGLVGFAVLWARL